MKRGISPVVATVLLLLITIIAVSMIAVFIVPFVKNNLTKSDECFAVLEDIGFDDGGYNCVASEGTEDFTGFSIKIDGSEIAGFKVFLFEGGKSEAYEILEGSQVPEIRMLDGIFNNSLEIPTNGGVRTYVAQGAFERAEINPLLKSGKPCKTTDSIRIRACIDPEIATSIKTEPFSIGPGLP